MIAEFQFSFTNSNEGNHLIEDLLNSSTAGICGISTKIIKAAKTIISPSLTFLFNKCIQQDQISCEWKTAMIPAKAMLIF